MKLITKDTYEGLPASLDFNNSNGIRARDVKLPWADPDPSWLWESKTTPLIYRANLSARSTSVRILMANPHR